MSDDDDGIVSSVVESVSEDAAGAKIWNWPVVLAIGAILGLVLLLGAAAGLILAEHWTLNKKAGLEEGAGNVESIPATKVDKANDNKLVHVTGEATTAESLADPDFGVSDKALVLEREVEVFQWKETKKETKKKKKTEVTYTYTQEWSKEKPKQNFHESKGHANPDEKPYADAKFYAANVKLGAFTLSPDQVKQLKATEALPVTPAMLAKLPADLKDKAAIDEDGRLFIGTKGKNVGAPVVGDARISYKVVKPQTVTVVAKQSGDTFAPFEAQSGASVDLIKPGAHDAQKMIESAQASNVGVQWVLRLGCLAAIWAGLFLIFRRQYIVTRGEAPESIFFTIGLAFFTFLLAVPVVLLLVGGRLVFSEPVDGGIALIAGLIGFIGVVLPARLISPTLFGVTKKWSAQEREAFRRVALDPEDGERRLELAALLEKKRDPMGEFIRINQEVEGLDEDHPRYAKLSERWGELLEKYGSMWFQPLKRLGLAPHIGDVFYPALWMTNGVIDTVTVDREGVLPEKADQLLAAVPGLRVLEIRNSRTVQGIAGWKDIDYKPKVRAIARLPQLKQLGALRVSSLELTAEDMEAVASSPSLTNLVELDFSYNKIGPEGAELLAQSTTLKRLRELELRSCDIGPKGAVALASSPILGKLVKLQLGANGIGRKGAAALAAAEQLKKLVELMLDENELGPVGVASIVSSPHLTRLTTLNLSGNEMGSEGALALAGAANLANLTKLELSSNKLGGEGLAALAGSPHLGQLRILEIPINEITPQGAKALAESTVMMQLEELHLGYNQIGNPGAVVLAAWPGLAGLRKLNLCDNKIGPPGIKAIAGAKHLKRLKDLDLGTNEVGKEGTEALADSPYLKNLENLWLSDANLTPAGEKILRKRFEDVVHIG
jgi:Ran GTPase-activating protein (RanGAP) involved in mRNA processing and transport